MGGETGSLPTHLIPPPSVSSQGQVSSPEVGSGILGAPGGISLPESQSGPGHLTQSPTMPHRNYYGTIMTETVIPN